MSPPWFKHEAIDSRGLDRIQTLNFQNPLAAFEFIRGLPSAEKEIVDTLVLKLFA